MANRRLDIVSRAVDIASGSFGTAAVSDLSRMTAVAASAEELAKKYEHLAGVLSTFAVVATSASEAFKRLYSEQKEAAKAAEDNKKPGTFWSLDLYEKGYESARGKYEGYTKDLMRKKAEEKNVLIDIEREYVTAVEGYNVIHASALNARQTVFTASYNAMGQEMLNLIATNKFSTEAFGKIITQQVKMELVGLAARAAVWAIFEAAMGLKDAAFGLPTAGMHFSSAATFASISGASLAAAAGVQYVIQGGREESKDMTSGTSTQARSLRGAPSLSGAAVPALPLTAQPQTRSEKNITVNIYNPISGKDVREAIVDIINDAGDMNYKINAKIIEAG